MSQSQPRLLIGLELEALVTAHKILPALPDQRRAQLATIVDAINSSFPSESESGCKRALAFTPISLWDRPSGALWNVTMGATDVDWANAAHVRPFGVRVASPSFVSGGVSSGKKGEGKKERDEDGEDGGDSAWKQEISTVLKAIDATVLWKPVPADEAGLSLHISAPANESFDLEGLKRFAMFLCRFEEALDTLGPVRTMNRNGRTLSNRFNPLLKDLSIDEVYSLIAQITDVEGLIEVMNFKGDAPVRAKPEDESMVVDEAEEKEEVVAEGDKITAADAGVGEETRVAEETVAREDAGVGKESVAVEEAGVNEETKNPEEAGVNDQPLNAEQTSIIIENQRTEPTGPAFNGGYLEECYFKVDFTHLRSSSPPKQTIIFRQHDGTTDGDAAAHWAHYMLRFVRFAFASTEEEVKGPPGGRENRMRHLNGLIPF